MSAQPEAPHPAAHHVELDESAWCASTPLRSKPTDGALRSVTTALDVLECFAVDGDLGVSDIARRLGIAKSTAHRVLTTLAARGFIEQDHETGHYRLGLHLFELGQLTISRNELRHAALPTLRQVATQTDLTVNFGIASGADIVFLERIEMGSSERVLGHAGRRFPAHVTSSGKAIAAFDLTLDRARREAGFPPRLRGTVRTEHDWAQALAQVRSRGYALAADESFDGVTTVAVPVLRGEHAIASVSIFGPNESVTPRVDRLVPLLKAAARRVSISASH